MSLQLTDYLELQRNKANNIDSNNSNDVAMAKIADKLPDPPPRSAMNALVLNYLLTEGFKDAAEKFQEEANLPSSAELMNLNDMDNRIQIRDAIQSGNISLAIDRVNQLFPELLDDDRYLFFHLQQQQMIELIREGKIEEALSFATEKLSERGEENRRVLEELERTMALLAFENPSNSPFADLLSHSHRQEVASELNSALLQAEHAECTQPRLANLLKLLLWSQSELDKKGIRFTKMIDLTGGKSRPEHK